MTVRSTTDPQVGRGCYSIIKTKKCGISSSILKDRDNRTIRRVHTLIITIEWPCCFHWRRMWRLPAMLSTMLPPWLWRRRLPRHSIQRSASSGTATTACCSI
ncbi:uncharacterized protein LOC142973347 isoform X2 [Anticarsia gemmatalis]|uniref:uncharacterized protein LOC142973347 isoform X2 n=1 Tax=Anticarsia gemmatalis TaxID=129554 RepID=UPI003F7679AF